MYAIIFFKFSDFQIEFEDRRRDIIHPYPSPGSYTHYTGSCICHCKIHCWVCPQQRHFPHKVKCLSMTLPKREAWYLRKFPFRHTHHRKKLWKRITAEPNDWNDHSKAEIWRKSWADICNEYLSLEQQELLEKLNAENRGLSAENRNLTVQNQKLAAQNRQLQKFIARYPILVILLLLSAQDRTDRKTIYVSLLYCRIVRYKENQA